MRRTDCRKEVTCRERAYLLKDQRAKVLSWEEDQGPADTVCMEGRAGFQSSGSFNYISVSLRNHFCVVGRRCGGSWLYNWLGKVAPWRMHLGMQRIPGGRLLSELESLTCNEDKRGCC